MLKQFLNLNFDKISHLMPKFSKLTIYVCPTKIDSIKKNLHFKIDLDIIEYSLTDISYKKSYITSFLQIFCIKLLSKLLKVIF